MIQHRLPRLVDEIVSPVLVAYANDAVVEVVATEHSASIDRLNHRFARRIDIAAEILFDDVGQAFGEIVGRRVLAGNGKLAGLVDEAVLPLEHHSRQAVVETGHYRPHVGFVLRLDGNLAAGINETPLAADLDIGHSFGKVQGVLEARGGDHLARRRDVGPMPGRRNGIKDRLLLGRSDGAAARRLHLARLPREGEAAVIFAELCQRDDDLLAVGLFQGGIALLDRDEFGFGRVVAVARRPCPRPSRRCRKAQQAGECNETKDGKSFHGITPGLSIREYAGKSGT